MARYRITEQMHLSHTGAQRQPGEEITLPDDHRPPLHWEPLDEPAWAAHAKAGGVLKRPAVAPAPSPPSTGAEVAGDKSKKPPRASDKSPV